MQKERKPQKRTTDYKPVFTDAEHKLMQNYGVGDLMDEVGVNRVMLMRTMDKMNEVREQLTFRDHLDALRAVSCSTGRIASLLDTRERLCQPYKAIEEHYGKLLQELEQTLEEHAIKLIGQEKWDDLQWNIMLEVLAKAPDGRRNGS